MNELTITELANDGRRWFTISGTDRGTGVDFEDNTYGLTVDKTILDCDGYPLTEGDTETIAVQNAINCIDNKPEKKITAKDFVLEQLTAKGGNGCGIEYGSFSVSTIRKAINSAGYRSKMDDCGNMYAVISHER